MPYDGGSNCIPVNLAIFSETKRNFYTCLSSVVSPFSSLMEWFFYLYTGSVKYKLGLIPSFIKFNKRDLEIGQLNEKKIYYQTIKPNTNRNTHT